MSAGISILCCASPLRLVLVVAAGTGGGGCGAVGTGAEGGAVGEAEVVAVVVLLPDNHAVLSPAT